MPPAFNLSQDQTLQFNTCHCRNSVILARRIIFTEDAHRYLLRLLKRHRSTHTNYLNNLLKISILPDFSIRQLLHCQDRPFYTPQIGCQPSRFALLLAAVPHPFQQARHFKWLQILLSTPFAAPLAPSLSPVHHIPQRAAHSPLITMILSSDTAPALG